MDSFKKKRGRKVLKEEIISKINKLAKKRYKKNEIAKKLNISYSSVDKYIDRNIIKKFDKELNKKIIKLYRKKDMGSVELAKIVGFKSKSSILKKLKKLNIKSKKAIPINSGLIEFNKLAEKNPELKKRIYEKVRESRKGKTWEEISGKEQTKELKEKLSRRMIEYNKKRLPTSKETREKISRTKKGIKNPKHAEFMRNNNPNWNGGSSFEPYPITFNKKFKYGIRKRDNYICLKCRKHQEKEGKSLCVHHIDYIKENTFKENCCALCNRCNLEVNNNRKHWTKFFQSMLSDLYNYNYTIDNEIILNIGEMNNEI